MTDTEYGKHSREDMLREMEDMDEGEPWYPSTMVEDLMIGLVALFGCMMFWIIFSFVEHHWIAPACRFIWHWINLPTT
jgi:hypothetical protein